MLVRLYLVGLPKIGGFDKAMEPSWGTYVGTITGITGALTGIAGLVMGWIAYRRSNQIQTADRRLELNKLRNSAHVAAVGLVDLLPQALRSRRAVLNARGVLHSSMMKQFEQQHQTDSERAKELAAQVPSTDESFDSLSVEEIEAKIVQLHRTKEWIDELVRTYSDHMVDDDRSRSELRNAQLGRRS